MGSSLQRATVIPLVLAVALAPSRASAAEGATEEAPGPWKLRLRFVGTLSFTHNHRVIGNPDGLTLQIGAELDTGADGRWGQHEWQNALTVQEGQSKTPLVDSFLKTSDALALTTTYLYHLPAVDWLGPFVRARLGTALLSGYHLQATDVDVVRSFSDGRTTTTLLPAQSRLDLTGPFEPLVFRQSGGLFALLDEGDHLMLDMKAGPAVQEIQTRGGFVLADDAATPELELQQLRDSLEAGASLAVEAKGNVAGSLAWSVSADAFYPFVTSIETDLRGLDRLNANLGTRLSVKLSGWASLDYTLVVTRVPLVLAEWQVQNGLLLSIGIDRRVPPPPPPPCPEGCVMPQ